MMAQSTVTLQDGAALAVSIDGMGSDLTLFSGLDGSAAFWDPVVAQLAASFRVIRFDQRGIGASTRGTAAMTIDTLADDGHAVLAQVARPGTLLLGHSMGGLIVQAMALKDERPIKGLVLSGTWARRNGALSGMFGAGSDIFASASRDYMGLAAFLGHPSDWLKTNASMFQGMFGDAMGMPAQQGVMSERMAAIMSFDRSSELGGIRAPTLVQGAEDDMIVPAFMQRELAGLMPKSAATFMPGGGHFFPVTRPEAFVESIVTFAKTIGHIA